MSGFQISETMKYHAGEIHWRAGSLDVSEQIPIFKTMGI
jgi:hypothetical protein